MAKEPKLERIDIAPECRAVKDWFPTRESAEAALPAIMAHITTTGQTHTCFCHTHTKPPENAPVVYLHEFAIPEKFRKAKRFCPCPCCWPEFGKFGQGRVGWFPEERIIRIIGEDCFDALNPEGHRLAVTQFEREREWKRHTEFLLSNGCKLSDVQDVITQAYFVAKVLEQFHEVLHDRLRLVRLNLWPYVRRNGELTINVPEKEFRRHSNGEIYTHEVHGTKIYAVLPGYKMLDPNLSRLSDTLRNISDRLRPFSYGDMWDERIANMGDEEKRSTAETLSRQVRNAKNAIAETRRVQRFVEKVSINTLRGWGADQGCPIPYNYAHHGTYISFGRSDAERVNVRLPKNILNHVGEVDFWTDLEPRRGK